MYRLWAPRRVDGASNGSPLSRVIGSYCSGEEKEVSLDRSQLKLAVRYGKGKEQRKERAMLERFDHRPKLTAALAIATIVLLVVVVTLSTLLITLQPAANPQSDSGRSNPGAAAAPANRDAGEHHDELVDYPNYRP
jgi:hypothetical protein